MKQLKLELTQNEEFEEFEVDGRIYHLGSPSYEKNIEDKIQFILDNNKKDRPSIHTPYQVFRGVKFWDVPQNVHLQIIKQMPGILLADDIFINLDSKADIEKTLLRKILSTYLVASHRLWREANPNINVLYVDGYKIHIISCGWESNLMQGIVNVIPSDPTLNSTHVVQIHNDNGKLEVSYPRLEFEHTKIPWKLSHSDFDAIIEKYKKQLFNLMVKLDIEIPEVK
jgi:hypothetical protein